MRCLEGRHQCKKVVRTLESRYNMIPSINLYNVSVILTFTLYSHEIPNAST